MANNRINFSVGYTVDKTGLQDLKQSLQEVQKAGEKATSGVSMEAGLKESCKAAQQLESILDDAWNNKLGELNLSKVNQGIKTTFGSVSNLRIALEQSGKVGSDAYNQVASSILNTNLQLKQSNKLLDDMATSMANTVKWGITSSIFNNLTGSIQKAFYFVKDLDSSLNDIRIVTNKSTEDMEAFAISANKAAKALAASTVDYTDASLIYYQQGLSDEDVAARAETTLKAANVTGQAGEEVSELLTAVWNGYKVSADEAELYIDKLAAVAATTASDLEELSTGMSKVASAANLMGVDVDQLNAQLATIVSVTRQAPESVGTALKTIYARMGDIEAGLDADVSLGNYTELMAEMGFNVLNMNGELRDMGEVIEEIGGKWQSMTREQQISLSQTMAGTRQYNNLLSLFDNWEMYTEALQTSTNAAGTLQHQQDIYMESTRAHLKQLKAEAEETYNTLLDADAINTFADTFTYVIGEFNDFINGLGGGTEAFIKFGAIAVNIFNQQIARSITATIDNIKALKNNIASINLKKTVSQDVINNVEIEREAKGISSKAGLEKEARLQEEILRVRKSLTSEQYNELTNLQQQIGLDEIKLSNARNYYQLLEKIVGANKLSLEALQRRLEDEKESVNTYKNYKIDLEEISLRMNELSDDQERNSDLAKKIANEYEETLKAAVDSFEEQGGEIEDISTFYQWLEGSAEERKSAEDFINKLLKNQHNLYQQSSDRVKKLEEAVKQRKFLESEEYQILLKQQLAREKLLQQQIQQAKKEQAIAKAMQIASGAVELLASSMGSVKILTDETSKGAEKANAAFSLTSGAISSIANMIAPGSGIIVTGIAQIVKSSIELLGLWDDIEFAFMSTEEKIEKTNERFTEANKLQKDFVSATNQINSIADEYTILANKAGEYGENIDELTETERDRYIELTNMLIDYNDEAVLGYGRHGEAIVNNHKLIEKTTELLKEQHEQEMANLFNASTLAEAEKLKKEQYNTAVQELTDLTLTKNLELQDSYIQNNVLDPFSTAVNKALTIGPDNPLLFLTTVDPADVVAVLEPLRELANIELTADLQRLAENPQAINVGTEEGLEQLRQKITNIQSVIESVDMMIPESDPVKDAYMKQLNDLISYYSDYVESMTTLNEEIQISNQNVKEQRKFSDSDYKNILSHIYNNPDFNDEWKRLEEAGMSDAQQMLEAYVFGFEQNEETPDLTSAIKKGEEFLQYLTSIFIDSGLWEQAQKEQLNRADFSSYEEYKKALVEKINEIMLNNADLMELAKTEDNVPILESILGQLFGVNDIKLDSSSGLITSVGTLTDDFYKAAVDTVIAKIGDNYSAEEINSLLHEIFDDYEIRDYENILNQVNWEAIALGVTTLEAELTATKEKVEELEKATSSFQSSDFLNILEKMKEQEELNEEELKILDALKEKYVDLNEYRNTNSKEYLKLLQEIREAEESNIIEEQKDIIEEELRNLEVINAKIEKERIRLQKEGLSEDEIEEQIQLYIDQEHLQDEIESSLDMISNANYEIKVAIDADLKSDVEDAFGLADEIHKLQTLVNQELKISIDEAQEIMNSAYAGMLQGAQATAEGMILLDENVVRAFITGKESEIEQDKQAKIEQLQHQRELLTAQLNILYTKQDLLSKAAAAETSQDKGKYLAQARMEEENYQNSVKIMQGELEADGELNKALSENAQNLYNALGGMYEADADNMASAARSADYNANNLFNNIIQYANASTNAINTVTTAIRWIGKKYATITSWGVARKGTGSSTANSRNVTSGFEVTSTGINAKDTGLSEAELNSVFDEVIAKYQQETSSQISNLLSQIGSIDAGIAALQTSSSQLQDYKANLGKPIETSSSNKKGSSGSGNKGSSGTGASSKDSDEFSDGEDTEYLERFKAEIDLYHDINIILGNIEEQLAKINKEQEKLTGVDLIASLQKEAKLLEQQVVALENKVLLEEIEAMQLQNALKQQGVKFNQEGDISNYAAILKAKEDYVNNIISKYNYMTEEEQEAYKDTVDQAQEDYDAFVETIQRYEEIMNNEIPDLEEQIQDAYNRQIEIQITQFDTKIQASLDLSEAEREWNEFKKKIIEGMDDEDIFGNAVLNFDNLKTYFADTEKSIPTLTQGLNQIIEDLKIINEGGEGSIFGDDEAAAIDSLKSYYEELMNGMEEVDELVKEIQQSYLDMLDEADEKFSKQIEGYEHIADIMNHGMNLTGLLYGDKAFAQFEHYYEQLAENNKKNLDFQRQEVEHWYKIMQSAEEGSDAWEKAKENFQDATAQLNSTVESAIENILSKYENAINRIFKNWEQNLTGGMSLDYLEEEWNLVNDNADDYLDKVNAAYEIRQLERKYQEAIDGTSSLEAQQKLNDLMTEELQMLQTKDRLSEYDVERANLKYQIALKELALDDAKKNKSQMRLRRDSQGNYSYQYVSDDTEISNAVDELEQLRNSLYNLDKNQLIENQNNILSSEQEFVSKLKDLYINYNVANIGETEEYLKQKELLEQQYQQKINNLLLENSEVRTNLEGSALEELAYMHGVNIESFQAMADAEREILMNQLIPQWDIGIADMISRINGEGGIAATMEELFIQLEEAVIQYGLDVRETLDAAGTSIDGYQGSIESLIDLNQELLSSNDDLIDSYEQQEKAILDLIESLKDLQTEYKGVKDEAIDALNAANALIMLQNKEAAKAQSNTNSKKPSTNSGSNGTGAGTGANTGTGTGGLTAGDIFSADDTKKPSSTNKNNTSSKKTESGDGTPSVGDKVKYISGRYYYDSTGTRPTGSQFQGEYVYITALNEKGSKPIHISTGSSLGNGDLGWLEKNQISGYDTGGYTGDWTGDKGRLALLHKKELVLKDTDTSNILDAVKIIRSINEVMFRNISSLATNIGTASSSIDYADKNINQNVTIHAEFPGVSFAKEIEDAFSNLTNVASQHAYR